MNTIIKKIIAREGLIILGFMLLGFLIGIIFPDIRYSDSSLRLLGRFPSFYTFGKFGYAVMVYGYSIYLLIRFIIWAVKVVREK